MPFLKSSEKGERSSISLSLSSLKGVKPFENGIILGESSIKQMIKQKTIRNLKTQQQICISPKQLNIEDKELVYKKINKREEQQTPIIKTQQFDESSLS